MRIEQPVDYPLPISRKKLTKLGFVFSTIGWCGFAWLMWCVVARVAR